MAKKKKIETEEKVISTPSSSGVIYNGSVNIKLVNKGRVVKSIKTHNTGNIPLFQFLAHCLTGSYDGNLRPVYIMGYHNGGTPTSSSLGTPAVYMLTPLADVKTKSITDGYSTSLKFTIPSSSIDTDVIKGNDALDVFGLYNATYKTYAEAGSNSCAFIKLDSEHEIKASDLATGVTVVIVWNMSITNPSV